MTGPIPIWYEPTALGPLNVIQDLWRTLKSYRNVIYYHKCAKFIGKFNKFNRIRITMVTVQEQMQERDKYIERALKDTNLPDPIKYELRKIVDKVKKP